MVRERSWQPLPSNATTSASIWLGETDRATKNDIDFVASSVPTEKLEAFDELVIDSLKKVVREGIDMAKIQVIIERERRKVCAM